MISALIFFVIYITGAAACSTVYVLDNHKAYHDDELMVVMILVALVPVLNWLAYMAAIRLVMIRNFETFRIENAVRSGWYK
jgi:hypothetical protein